VKFIATIFCEAKYASDNIETLKYANCCREAKKEEYTLERYYNKK